MTTTKEKWSEKILHITLKIKEQYPELGKFLDEMPIIIPDEKNLEITLLDLKQYLESLNSLLKKYIIEQTSKKA